MFVARQCSADVPPSPMVPKVVARRYRQRRDKKLRWPIEGGPVSWPQGRRLHAPRGRPRRPARYPLWMGLAISHNLVQQVPKRCLNLVILPDVVFQKMEAVGPFHSLLQGRVFPRLGHDIMRARGRRFQSDVFKD